MSEYLNHLKFHTKPLIDKQSNIFWCWLCDILKIERVQNNIRRLYLFAITDGILFIENLEILLAKCHSKTLSQGSLTEGDIAIWVPKPSKIPY